MFTTTPEKPAWILSALSIIGGVILVAVGRPVPELLQALALAGLVAAVALADAGTSNVFAWGLVILGLLGIFVLALLQDPLPTWLEAVTALSVAGGSSLSVPTSVPKIVVTGSTGPGGANSGPVVPQTPGHIVGR